MKKLIIILFWLLTVSLQAATYYIAPTTATPAGNDANAGTLAAPWATIGKAFSVVVAGDTAFLRGGVYMVPASNDGAGYSLTGKSGTAINKIVISNYQNEVPIIDFDDVITGPTTTKYGISFLTCNYVHLIGITVRNLNQLSDNPADPALSRAFYFSYSNNITVERCVAYHIDGNGFSTINTNPCDELYYIDCDAYDCNDRLSPVLPGNDGSGFTNGNSKQLDYHVYYKRCRAWDNGDQGFSFGSYSYVECDSCWSFRNGKLQGEGWGWKTGWISATYDGQVKRKIVNCIAAYNRRSGFDTNDGGTPAHYQQFYNNTSYRNGYQGGASAYGFSFRNTVGTDEQELKREVKNNISYGNESGNIYIQSGALYTHVTNSWDDPPGITIAPSDFISLDSAGLIAPRQTDGSFPDNVCYNKFLHLSETSQARGEGTDEGYGDDLGAFQYSVQEDSEEPLVLSDLSTFRPYWQTETTAISGGNVYDAGGGTVSARGVCWNTTGTPTTADSKTEDGTGTGIFYSQMTGLSRDAAYYVRAYATNEIGTAYGNQMTFRTSQVLYKDGKVYVIGGKVLVTP